MTRPLIYVVACEASGDELGARLMEALHAETGGNVDIVGIGGPAMTAAGLQSLFDPSELALIGVFEVLPKAAMVLRRVRQTVADIVARKPDVLVTIDSWGFTGRIHQRLARMGHPARRVRYVAPQVWAWRPGRARQLAQWIQHLMTLLPFEPPYFAAVGLPATWVGHPVIESGADRGDASRFRSRYGIEPSTPVLTVLPGSRTSEVKQLLPIFSDTVKLLGKSHPNLVVAIPAVPHVADLIRTLTNGWQTRPILVDGVRDKYDPFAASSAALAASGTVSLELAMAGLPHVIGYRVNPLTAFVVKRLIRTKYVNLVNVMLDRMVIPERLQGECRADVLAADVAALMAGGPDAARMRAEFKAAVAQLSPDGVTPSRAAARTVLTLLG